VGPPVRVSNRLLTTGLPRSGIVEIVTDETARADLPLSYQRLLAYLDEGCTEDEIARRLQIDARSVAPMIELANAKLERLAKGNQP